MIRKTARMLGRLWTWGIIAMLALGLVGLVQDLATKGRSMPRVRFGLSMLALAAVFWNVSQMTGSGRGVTKPNDARQEIRLVQWNVMWGTRDKVERWKTV